MVWETFLTDVSTKLRDSLLDLLTGVLNSIPGFLGAIIILLIGYLVALLISAGIRKGLEQSKVDHYLIERTSLSKAIGGLKLSYILSLLSKWYIFVLFFLPASEIIGLDVVAIFLTQVSLWVPRIIAASILGLVGLIAAEYTRERILETKLKSAKPVAQGVKLLIIVFTAIVVLKQISVDIEIAENLVLVIVSGIMLAVALALGIGFGQALKDEASNIIKGLKKKV